MNFHFQPPRRTLARAGSCSLLTTLKLTSLSISQDCSQYTIPKVNTLHSACQTPEYPDQHILKMDIRLLHPSDIPHVQTTNITNLPENYFCKYYMYHQLSWPQLSYVAVDVSLYRLWQMEQSYR
jgi:hypothetical protein